MSRKNRKQSRPNQVSVSSNISSRTTNSRSEEPFNPDYSYVIRDLKRIGTLAASFLAILFILAIFLR